MKRNMLERWSVPPLVLCAGCLLPNVEFEQRDDSRATTTSHSAQGQLDGATPAQSEVDASAPPTMSGTADAGSGKPSVADASMHAATRLGEPCSIAGALACTSAGSSQRVTCDGSHWMSAEPCEPGKRCNTEDTSRVGECMYAQVECQDKLPNVPYCASSVTPRVCGIDLVSSRNLPLCELPTPDCMGGACTCLNVCDGTCRDVRSDAEHCGSCGHSCGEGQCRSNECYGVLLSSADGPTTPQGLAQDATRLYWTSRMGVMSISKNGGSPSTLVRRELDGRGIAVDAAYVYWSDIQSHVISKAPIAGGGPVDIATSVSPEHLAVSDTYLYVAVYDEVGTGSIAKIPVAGGTLEVVAANQGTVGSIVLDSQYVYWTSYSDLSGAIMKAAIAGGAASKVANASPMLDRLALLNDELFWIEGDSIMKVSASGGQPSPIANNGALDIAADDSHIYLKRSASIAKVSISDGASEMLVRSDGYSIGLVVDQSDVYFVGAAGVYKFRK